MARSWSSSLSEKGTLAWAVGWSDWWCEGVIRERSPVVAWAKGE